MGLKGKNVVAFGSAHFCYLSVLQVNILIWELSEDPLVAVLLSPQGHSICHESYSHNMRLPKRCGVLLVELKEGKGRAGGEQQHCWGAKGFLW